MQEIKDQSEQPYQALKHVPQEEPSCYLYFFFRFSKFRNRETIASIRTLLMQKKLHKFELAALANLCPESAEEVSIPVSAHRCSNLCICIVSLSFFLMMRGAIIQILQDGVQHCTLLNC
mgnify:CR=1 FL=1